MQSEALLMGRLFDDRGNRMSPTHACKGSIKYRYYVSSALLDGRPEEARSTARVPAPEIEALVARSVREHLKFPKEQDDKTIIVAHALRIEVHPTEITIQIRGDEKPDRETSPGLIRVPWQKQPAKLRREVLLPASKESSDRRPIRSETRATLIAAIARGRRWLDEIVKDPEATAERIAHREGCSARKVNMTISLAFLSPALVKAALEGRLPRGVGVTRLCDMPAEWSRQHQTLGLDL
jgi:site-specific DNA recombinase